MLTGAGAAGAATSRMLVSAGAGRGALLRPQRNPLPGPRGARPVKAALAEETNPGGRAGTADEALAGADVYIGLSRPAPSRSKAIRSMADKDAIVFAMANPTPEIAPEEIEDMVAVVGTGRSDYPNQINNVLVFPGDLPRRARCARPTITREMELAAAHALAAVIEPEHLEADYVIPSVFDRRAAPAVAEAVARAAEAETRKVIS